MATSWNATLPPFAYTGTFTSNWKTQPLQEYVYKLSLSPGSYQISVLPDLIALTTAIGAVTADDINWFTEEAMISSAYIARTVKYYDSTGLYYTSDSTVTALQSREDSLALQEMAAQGVLPNYGGFNYYDATVTIEAETTIEGATTRYVYTSDYYLYVSGWNYSYPHEPDGTEIPLSGRFLITLGNPTGQRTQTWGSDWLNLESFVDYYVPPVTPPPTTEEPQDVDPRTATGPMTWSQTADGQGIKTAAHVADSLAWAATETIKEYFANGFEDALDDFEVLAETRGNTLLLGAIDYYRKIKTAYDLYGEYQENYQFLRDHNAEFLAHVRRGFDLAINPNATLADAETYFSETLALGSKYATDATRLAISKVPGGDTLLRVYDAFKYVAQQENSVSFSLYSFATPTLSADQPQAVICGTDDDTIQGGSARDILFGGDGADSLLSGAGDDWVSGSVGNDTLDGNAGTDTASYSGLRANYTVTKTAAGHTVRDNAGNEGSDTLTGVEKLKFSDYAIDLAIADKAEALPTTDLNSLIELYVAYFNRVPEAEGLSYWIDQLSGGQSFDQIAQSFYVAGVQYSQYTGYSSTMSEADFVRVVYENVLGRTGSTAPPDADVNYWAGTISSGATTRGALIKTMLASAHTFEGDPTWGWVPQLLDNKISVATTHAVQDGVCYDTSEEAITKGMAIAEMVTADDIQAAIALIGVPTIESVI